MIRISSLAFAMTAAATLAYAAPGAPTDASARLIDAKGQSIGVALFHQTPKGVQIDLSVRGLTSGPHGVHIHAVGKCEQAKLFASAGAHFDAGGHKHGRMNPKGPHTGDMDNATANKYGIVRVTIVDASITLGPGPTSVLDADGSAIVVHQSPDDYKTDPAGGSGDRVACGVIKAM